MRAAPSIFVLMATMLSIACSPAFDEPLPLPEQGATVAENVVLDSDGKIKRLASFESRTLVLRRKDYEPGNAEDPLGEFAPVDMVMAWGDAGRLAGREGVSLAQGRRRYSWQASGEVWSRSEVKSFGLNTANWHLIPANSQIADRIADIDEGDVVRIKGDLVSVDLADGNVARSSLVRDDSGDGACEIIRVTQIEVVDQP